MALTEIRLEDLNPGQFIAEQVEAIRAAVGEVTRERVQTVRKATAIVEYELRQTVAFQYLAILHLDRVTGIRNGRREFGQQVEVRCWDPTASPGG